LVAVAVVLSGLLMVASAFVLGDCAAFGGRCPREVPPLVEDDVFVFAALGAGLMVSVPVFVARPSWRRLGLAVMVGLCAGVLVGLAARNSA